MLLVSALTIEKRCSFIAFGQEDSKIMFLDKYVHNKTSWRAGLAASKAKKTKEKQTYALI